MLHTTVASLCWLMQNDLQYVICTRTRKKYSNSDASQMKNAYNVGTWDILRLECEYIESSTVSQLAVDQYRILVKQVDRRINDHSIVCCVMGVTILHASCLRRALGKPRHRFQRVWVKNRDCPTVWKVCFQSEFGWRIVTALRFEKCVFRFRWGYI